jgi:hypothetical protein
VIDGGGMYFSHKDPKKRYKLGKNAVWQTVLQKIWVDGEGKHFLQLVRKIICSV